MGSTPVIRTADFEKEVLQAEGLVLVDFFAPWCPPCQRLEPELEKVQAELGDKIKIVKLDVDQDEPLSLVYNVQKIPNMTFFRDGKVLDQYIGLLPKRDILKRIEALAEPAIS